MSARPAEVVNGLLDCVRARDFDRLDEFLHPEVEWTTSGLYLEAGIFTGKAEVRGYMERIATEFDPWKVELVDVREVGPTAVSHVRVGGRGALSGAQVVMDLYTVAHVEQGRIRRARNYRERDEALRAATAASPSR